MDSLRSSTASAPLIEDPEIGDAYIEWQDQDSAHTAPPSSSFRRVATKAVSLALLVGVVAFVSVMVLRRGLNDADGTPKQAPPSVGVDDLDGKVVPGFTCGKILVHGCSHEGGYCKDVKSWTCKASGLFGGTCEVCKCRAGYENRSSTCDWGPVEVPDPKPTWAASTLSRILLAYDASNLAYDLVTAHWTSYDGRGGIWSTLTTGHAYGATDNGNSSAIWYQHCPSALTTYGTSWSQYKFEDIGELDATHVGVGRVQAAASPSGEEEIMVSFGGTFSATEPFGQLEQVLTDVDISSKDLRWKGQDLGQVHAGFYSAVVPMVKPLLDLIRYSGLTKVTVTGHSLGAAEALVFGAILSVDQPELDIYLYTFGTPRTGSPEFASSLSKASKVDLLRFVNQLDLISMVPTSVGLGDSVLHAGPQVTLGFEDVGEACRDYFVTDQYTALLKSPIAALKGCPQKAAKDHLTYKDNIYDWLRAHGMQAVPPPANSEPTF